jgi:hypothetical protein
VLVVDRAGNLILETAAGRRTGAGGQPSAGAAGEECWP